MISDTPTLLAALVARGLLTPEAVAPADARADVIHRPWYIALLLGVSGWLAGLFTLGFVALLFKLESGAAAGVAGGMLLVAAWGLFMADRAGVFVAQLALALSIAGQCLVLYAMNEHGSALAPIAFSALVLQAVLALVMPNWLHRLLSAFFATIAWALAVRFALFGEPQFWHHAEAALPSLGITLGGWLLVWLPVGCAIWIAIRHESTWMARGWQPVVRPLLAGGVVGLAIATVASQPFESFDGFAERGSVGWLALWPLLSALAALGGAAAGFALRSRALVGVCIVGMVGHLAHFHVELGLTLLQKSLLLMVIGAALLWAGRRLGKGVSA